MIRMIGLSSFSVWSPAVRDGHWQEYLQFDFLGLAQVNRIKIGTEATIGSKDVRVVKKVCTYLCIFVSRSGFVG